MHIHMHTFEVNGQYYVLDTENLHFFRCSRNAFHYISQCIRRGALTNCLPEELGHLPVYIQRGMFASEKNERRQELFVGKHTFNVSFPPEHRCNYQCKYCFARAGKQYIDGCKSYTPSTLRHTMKAVYENLASNYEILRFDFVSGGEPLLNVPIIEDFLTLIGEMDHTYKKTSRCFLVTNGSLMTEETAKLLDVHHVDIGISIDGDRTAHDANRVYPDGKGTYDDTVAGLETLKQSDVSRRTKDIWALGVFTKGSKGIVETLLHYRLLDIARAEIRPARGVHDNLSFSMQEWDILKTQYEALFRRIIEDIVRKDTTLFRMIINNHDTAGKMLKRLLLGQPVSYRCEAGKNKVSICANGDIYPCDSFVGMKEFRIGTIQDGIDQKAVRIFQNLRVDKTNCRHCWAKHVCGGDCYFNSYAVNGTFDKPDPLICRLNKFIISQAIYTLLFLKETDSDLFAKELNLAKRRNEMTA